MPVLPLFSKLFEKAKKNISEIVLKKGAKRAKSEIAYKS